MGQEARIIYLVGANRLLNQLMALRIEQELEARCFLRSSIEEVPRNEGGAEPPPRMILCDCFRKNIDELHDLLHQIDAWHQDRDLLALFNLQRSSCIEPQALDCGIRGFFYEQDGPECLGRLILTLFQGEIWMPRKVLSACLLARHVSSSPRTVPSLPLTRREVQILKLLESGAANQGIADSLCISPHTVKTHLYNIFKKFDVRNRLQAAQWAARNLK